MSIADLLSDLRLDLGDVSAEVLADDYLRRCILKSVPVVNSDINVDYSVVDDALSPEPTNDHRELIILRSQIFACSLMRSITAGNFAFSSADKKIDKTKQPGFWKEQEETLLARYRERVKAVNPDNSSLDDGLLATGNITPLVYEIESETCDEPACCKG